MTARTGRNTFSGTFALRVAANVDTGQRAQQQAAQQHQVHRAQRQMPHPGQRGQRHGMDDVRTHHFHRRHARVQEQQRDRPSTPAPMEEIVTNAPTITPVAIVAAGK